MIPADVNMREAYARSSDVEQKLIQNLALFLSTFMKEHGALVESDTLANRPAPATASLSVPSAHALVLLRE